jgi:coenzyme PQQ synthesis protein D (PqqD)
MRSGPTPGDSASDSDQAACFVRAQESLWRQLAGVTLVRTVDNPEVVELWGTGLLLWAALVEPVTADELASDLAALVDAPLDVVARDVREALADLVRRGVVMQLEVS